MVVTKVLLLYDEITPAAAKEFVRELTKLPPTAEVTIAINSPGGSRTSWRCHRSSYRPAQRDYYCRIDGVAASAASYIAMFADRIIMSKGSFLMIHEPLCHHGWRRRLSLRTRPDLARYRGEVPRHLRCAQRPGRSQGARLDGGRNLVRRASGGGGRARRRDRPALARAKAVSAAVLKLPSIPGGASNGQSQVAGAPEQRDGLAPTSVDRSAGQIRP